MPAFACTTVTDYWEVYPLMAWGHAALTDGDVWPVEVVLAKFDRRFFLPPLSRTKVRINQRK